MRKREKERVKARERERDEESVTDLIYSSLITLVEKREPRVERDVGREGRQEKTGEGRERGKGETREKSGLEQR